MEMVQGGVSAVHVARVTPDGDYWSSHAAAAIVETTDWASIGLYRSWDSDDSAASLHRDATVLCGGLSPELMVAVESTHRDLSILFRGHYRNMGSTTWR